MVMTNAMYTTSEKYDMIIFWNLASNQVTIGIEQRMKEWMDIMKCPHILLQ
jgi:lipoate-protein ligase A